MQPLGGPDSAMFKLTIRYNYEHAINYTYIWLADDNKTWAYDPNLLQEKAYMSSSDDMVWGNYFFPTMIQKMSKMTLILCRSVLLYQSKFLVLMAYNIRSMSWV